MIKIGIMLVLVGTLIISSLTTQVYARNITAFIHINEEAIDRGDLKHMAWYTVDGKNQISLACCGWKVLFKLAS